MIGIGLLVLVIGAGRGSGASDAVVDIECDVGAGGGIDDLGALVSVAPPRHLLPPVWGGFRACAAFFTPLERENFSSLALFFASLSLNRAAEYIPLKILDIVSSCTLIVLGLSRSPKHFATWPR